MRRSVVILVVSLLALNAGLFLVQPGHALPAGLGTYFFGPKLVRAEVIVREGDGLRDYRIDRGVVRAVRAGSLTLRELDGTVVVVRVSPGAEVQLNGRASRLGALRRGMTVTTVRSGSAPASVVRAFR